MEEPSAEESFVEKLSMGAGVLQEGTLLEDALLEGTLLEGTLLEGTLLEGTLLVAAHAKDLEPGFTILDLQNCG